MQDGQQNTGVKVQGLRNIIASFHCTDNERYILMETNHALALIFEHRSSEPIPLCKTLE